MSSSDYANYKKMYEAALSAEGREALGESRATQDRVVKTLNAFMDAFPKLENPDLRPATPVTQLTLREIYRRTMVTAIDILNDVSKILTDRSQESSSTTHRRLFAAFTQPDRRLYVGLWVLFFALILYFLDATA